MDGLKASTQVTFSAIGKSLSERNGLRHFRSVI